jgi:ribosomal protein S18 acetylase RimI-like enzyme
MKIVIKPLTKENLDDFLNFFDNIAFTNNQSWSGCYCFYHHFDGSNEEWEQRTAENNREAAVKLIQKGIMKGYLVFHEDKPVGWRNVNDKANFSGLVSNKETWDNFDKKICSIVCFIIAPEYRRKGLASQILNVICNDFSRNDYDYIEAYPRKGELTSAEQYHGPSAMYANAGFTLYKEFEDYNVVRKKL